MIHVKLIDVDSKIPNLALMKLSTFHKAAGNVISFEEENPDKIYASIIFKKNKDKLNNLQNQYPLSEIEIGGSGYDLTLKLPKEIEYLKPDYTLYPNCDYSIGYSTRGCIRNNQSCPFCIVPIKEGKFKIAQHPSEWYNPNFNKIVFLDNNILSNKKWFLEILKWCNDKKLSVWFTQGLDIRLLDEEIAKSLLKMKIFKGIFFAWDHIEDELLIKTKIQLLKDIGFTKSKLRNFIQFYVYIDSDAEYDSGVYRCNELKSLGCNPFIMYNIDIKPTKRIQNLKRWANRKQIFWSCDISEYDSSKYSKNIAL